MAAKLTKRCDELSGGVGAALSVNCRRYDSTGISGSLAAGEEAFQSDVLEGFAVADYSDW